MYVGEKRKKAYLCVQPLRYSPALSAFRHLIFTVHLLQVEFVIIVIYLSLEKAGT